LTIRILSTILTSTGHLIDFREEKENGAHSDKKYTVLPKNLTRRLILSLPSLEAPGKPKKPFRIRPAYREGLNIQYNLKDREFSFSKIASKLKVNSSLVSRVVFGRRRSTRVEAEIARLLGAADWNEVVLEARSAVTGKPVKTLVKEFSRQVTERRKAALERISADISAELASRKRRAG
jgi:hypothetical protein